MMMKRTRALEGRQYRRTVKKSRFTESVYFNTSTFGYLKLFSIWISCITIDLVVGCRLELGWPILLFVRHYSEIVGAPNGTLRFHSTFSIFYLFLTLTSDLICYLFLPVQQLLFFASTYVWLQFTYQTIDRGLSPPVIGFCVLFVCFEYFLRYQITNPHWYESRSLLLTASLLPTVTDAFLANQMSTTRLALYRIFASHSLGFPLVTFGFRLKGIVSDWLYEKRRESVQRKNEIFDKILTEAIPMVYEGKKRHEINTRQHLALEGEALDFELDPTGSDFLDEPRYGFSSNGPVPSIFDKLGHGSSQTLKSSVDGVPYTKKPKSKPSGSLKHQNGSANGHISKNTKHKNSVSSITSRSNGSHLVNSEDGGTGDSGGDEDYQFPKNSLGLISGSAWLILQIQSFFVNWLLSIFSIVRSTGNAVVEHAIYVSGSKTDATVAIGNDQDDQISTSGDGSQNADDESDRESIMTNTMEINERNSKNGWMNNKKKNKKRTSTMDSPEGEFEIQCSNGIKNRKGKQEEKKEDEIERLKTDIRAARLVESELREQISGLHQFEKSAKNEVQQYRMRYEQLDMKYKAIIKQQEQNKITIANLEKRILDAQNRKDQIEKELMMERTAAMRTGTFDAKTNDAFVESLKTKITKLENELKKSRSEVRNKEDLSIKLETKLKEMQNQKSLAQKNADDGSLTVSRLEHENAQLKKALSEENRVKQDLFLALKTSKAKIDTLQAKMKSMGIIEDNENSNTVTGSNGDIFRVSPTMIGSSSSPPVSRFIDLDNQIMGNPFSGLTGIRSSPSEYLRDSPTTLAQIMGIPLDVSQHVATTHSN